MTFVGLLNFPEIALCACVWRLSAIWCRQYLFFIDRSIYRIRWAEIDVTKSRAFYCNPTIFSVGAKLFSFIWFLFSFFFFPLWRTKQEGEYVLEKQVNGQGVSPYDPSHNSTAVLVGKPNLWFVISQWTDEIRDNFFFFFFRLDVDVDGCVQFPSTFLVWFRGIFPGKMSFDLVVETRNRIAQSSLSLSWFVSLSDCLFVYIRWWIVCRYGGRFLRNGSAHLPGTATYRTVRRYQPQR